MKLCIDGRSWFKCCRTEVFSPRILRLYPMELSKLMRMVVRTSKRLAVSRYLFMYVFEVFWSVYFGPVMPWSATCFDCLAHRLNICVGGLDVVTCMLRRSAKEVKRLRNSKDSKIVVKVCPGDQRRGAPRSACLGGKPF